MNAPADTLTATQVATELGIQPATFRTYVMRGQAPKADGYHDKRTPYWLRSTIVAWRPTMKG